MNGQKGIHHLNSIWYFADHWNQCAHSTWAYNHYNHREACNPFCRSYRRYSFSLLTVKSRFTTWLRAYIWFSGIAWIFSIRKIRDLGRAVLAKRHCLFSASTLCTAKFVILHKVYMQFLRKREVHLLPSSHLATLLIISVLLLLIFFTWKALFKGMECKMTYLKWLSLSIIHKALSPWEFSLKFNSNQFLIFSEGNETSGRLQAT